MRHFRPIFIKVALNSVLIGGFTKFKNLWIAKRTPAAILGEFNTGGSKKDVGGTPVYLQCGENPARRAAGEEPCPSSHLSAAEKALRA